MASGNLMRVDKMAMRYTLETRCPFFDTALVEFALSLPGAHKVNDQTTKYILREVARSFLPDYIADREKMPFALGAGMDVGNNFTQSDGVLSALAISAVSDQRFLHLQRANPATELRTKEDAMLFLLYKKYGYAKLQKNGRPVMKDTLVETVRETFT